jgi:nucleoside-diphosphate-sugar epimerase
MKRVLVTGISGFVGLHIVEPLLVRGFEVHGVSSTPRALSDAVTLHNVDLLAPGAAEKLVTLIEPTHFLHLAWVSNPGRAMMSLDNVRWVATSLELFRSFVEAGGRRAVLVGSCAEYDWGHSELHETQTPLRPRSVYGAAKNALREVVEAVARQTDVSTAWARLFFLFGPHEPPGRLVSEIASGLVAGTMTKTTEGRQERDFLHVADAADALARLLDSTVSGSINVASGACVPVRRVIDVLGQLSGRPDLLAVGARPTSPDEPMRLAADIGRLRQEVGFVPRYPLDEGLAATLQWWRDATRPAH